MGGTCFKYRNKLVLWDSGMGNPCYMYVVYPKGSRDKQGFLIPDARIKFGYNTKGEQEKTFDKVKEYVDNNINKLIGCRVCKCKCNVEKGGKR